MLQNYGNHNKVFVYHTSLSCNDTFKLTEYSRWLHLTFL